MHSDSKKRRSFLALLFAAGDLRRYFSIGQWFRFENKIDSFQAFVTVCLYRSTKRRRNIIPIQNIYSERQFGFLKCFLDFGEEFPVERGFALDGKVEV